MTDLDIVIPVYNEGENIRSVFAALESKVQTSARIIIVYDEESDTTLPVVRKMGSHKFQVETVKNKSHGAHAAVMTGFAFSRAPAVLCFPADDLENEGLIDAMVAELKKGMDLVCASRFIPGGTMEGCPVLKAVLVRLASFSLFHLARLPVHDATNGFRLFSRRVLDTISIESNQGFTFSLEILVKVHRLRWPVSEIPAIWRERTSGQSRFRVFKWLGPYLRWYFYAFQTTFLRQGAETVPLKTQEVA